ncbi:hypothetical protein [uncultured Desulfovibrio sp.]|uniref:hypothetical protein n=1 Tax=uncultured Desulfovibrio sp. TaxID=167968 RepID=UPI0026099889|nr:hypothetical protein [uncultured Desulfovibrio sp.]
MKLICCDKAAEVLQLGEHPLDFPTAAITPQGAAILCFGALFRFGAMISIPQSSSSLASSLSLSQALSPIKRLGSSLANTLSGVLNQDHFMIRRACHVKGGRKIGGVRHCHDPGALAALGSTNGTAPFFTGANVPSVDKGFP